MKIKTTLTKSDARRRVDSVIDRKDVGAPLVHAPSHGRNPAFELKPPFQRNGAEHRAGAGRSKGQARKAWVPILEGRERKQAAEVIAAISDAFRQETVRGMAPRSAHRRHSRTTTDSSLAGGSAGLAVFHACLSEAGLMADAGHYALTFLSNAVDHLAAGPGGPSLFGGFIGTAWAVTQLEGRLFDAGDQDPNEAIDETLRQLLARPHWRGAYDVAGGLAGFGVYALERLGRPIGRECLELVVDRLDEIAERSELGATWFTDPNRLPAQQRNDCPDGHYNLGLAHGVPGVIALLGRICARREEGLAHAQEKALPLLTQAVSWLLAQQPVNQGYSSWVGPGIQPNPARLAWCYGDLGIAVALLQAARATQNTAWERESLKIAHRAARRSVEKSGVVDCGLCHGAAGVANLFNRLYQATGDETLKRAACTWFSRTLAMRRVDKGVAGFPKYTPDPNLPKDQRWTAEPGLLEGAAGVGLALLGAISHREPSWDRMMLVSI